MHYPGSECWGMRLTLYGVGKESHIGFDYDFFPKL